MIWWAFWALQMSLINEAKVWAQSALSLTLQITNSFESEYWMHLAFRLELNAIVRELSSQDLQCVWLQLLFNFDLTRASGRRRSISRRRSRRRNRGRSNNQHFTQYFVGHPQSLQLISLSIWLRSLLILQSVRITAGVCVCVSVLVCLHLTANVLIKVGKRGQLAGVVKPMPMPSRAWHGNYF